MAREVQAFADRLRPEAWTTGQTSFRGDLGEAPGELLERLDHSDHALSGTRSCRRSRSETGRSASVAARWRAGLLEGEGVHALRERFSRVDLIAFEDVTEPLTAGASTRSNVRRFATCCLVSVVDSADDERYLRELLPQDEAGRGHASKVFPTGMQDDFPAFRLTLEQEP